MYVFIEEETDTKISDINFYNHYLGKKKSHC